jgi:membrane-associated phospholipid phosphatase
MKNIIKKNWIWIIFLIAIIGFIAILEDVFEQEIMKLDLLSYSILVEKLRNSILTSIMKIITNLGGAIVLLVISVLSLILIKKKKIGFAICINLIMISAFNVIVKNIIQRPRPYGYRLINESGYSFPSGHSMISTAVYGFLIYLIYKNVRNKVLRNILCIILGMLILMISISRVYLGVHYASDVLAGFLLSIAYLICYVKAYNFIKIGEK